MFLQSSVVPVVLYAMTPDSVVNVKEAMGTAFFIGTKGYFLTAGHVLRAAIQGAKEKGLHVGLVVKGDQGESPESFVTPMVVWQKAPDPYDVALGKVNVTLADSVTKNLFHPQGVDVWQRVATYGYPLNAMSGDPTHLKINLRAHKGIVQRVLSAGDLSLPASPAGYELSFLVGTGMSGSPLFIYREENINSLIGICVGSSRTEEIDEVTEVEQDGKLFRETKLRITEYGIAHDLISLMDWKPTMLLGKTLKDVSEDVPIRP